MFFSFLLMICLHPILKTDTRFPPDSWSQMWKISFKCSIWLYYLKDLLSLTKYDKCLLLKKTKCFKIKTFSNFKCLRTKYNTADWMCLTQNFLLFIHGVIMQPFKFDVAKTCKFLTVHVIIKFICANLKGDNTVTFSIIEFQHPTCQMFYKTDQCILESWFDYNFSERLFEILQKLT